MTIEYGCRMCLFKNGEYQSYWEWFATEKEAHYCGDFFINKCRPFYDADRQYEIYRREEDGDDVKWTKIYESLIGEGTWVI